MASARVHVPALLLVLVPVVALAQGQPQAPPGPAAPATAAPSAAPASGAAGAGAAPAPTATGPKVEATGYGYTDTPVRSNVRAGAARRHVAASSGPVATLPGFEMLADGGSRLFVQLTQNVQVEEKKATGTVTYVLKGAHVVKHNNQNALVTVHFNTPVSRARLVPRGRDLLFIVEMRSKVTPTWKMEAAKDNTAILAIDFPKGDFLPNTPAPPDDDDAEKKAPNPQPTTPPETKG